MNPEDVGEFLLNFEKAALEHIIPQNPAKDSNWTLNITTLFLKEYTYKLGNMTLLTQKVNSAARNYDFERKREFAQMISCTLLGVWLV